MMTMVEVRVLDAIDDFYAGIHEIEEEIGEEWSDADGQRAITLDGIGRALCLSTIQEPSYIEIIFADLKCMVPERDPQQPRCARINTTAAYAASAVAAIRRWCDDPDIPTVDADDIRGLRAWCDKMEEHKNIAEAQSRLLAASEAIWHGHLPKSKH